jgi:hypothetical protein
VLTDSTLLKSTIEEDSLSCKWLYLLSGSADLIRQRHTQQWHLTKVILVQLTKQTHRVYNEDGSKKDVQTMLETIVPAVEGNHSNSSSELKDSWSRQA